MTCNVILPMDLIIKVTDRCNFACTFCSSPDISSGAKSNDLDINLVKKFLHRYPNTDTIILNGGDPLMIPPDYYLELISILEKLNYDTTISFTSNLWDFYKRPHKWVDIFKHSRVGVTTSFNYGGSRRITKEKEFTEEDFIQVSNLFLKEVGYRPDFISVVTEETKDTAINNVKLAKRLGVQCKLNNAFASGRSGKPFPLGEMYQIYAEIHEQGLSQHESNIQNILKGIDERHTTCPLSLNCQESIRCIQPNGYTACGAFGDDGLFKINFDEEMEGYHLDPYKGREEQVRVMKIECFACPYFKYCNSCKKVIYDHKKHDIVEKSCVSMKEAWKKLKK